MAPAVGRSPSPPGGDPDFQPDPDGLALAVDALSAHASGGRLRGDGPRSALACVSAPELPELGVGSRRALVELALPALGEARSLGDPGYCAHMDPPTPWVSWAAALWVASRNQNLLHPDTAPVARDVEETVIRWVAPFFAMGGGHLVPGSTVANLTALWAARELRGVREVVASEAAHLSLRKSANLLGLAYRTVPIDDHDRLDPAGLGDLSRAALVLTAGTTVMGSLDPLEAGRDAAWRHLDAAWAGPLRFSDRFAGLLAGVEDMDSVAVSAHKLMFQPKECAIVLFADAERAHGALSFGAGYLSVPNVGLLGSHGAAGLPLMATLLAWGRRGLADRIERCMDLAEDLDELIVADEGFERVARPVTGIVLWRPQHVDVSGVLDHLHASSVSLGWHRDGQWLRSVFANPQADPQMVMDDVRRVVADLGVRASAGQR